MLSVSDFAEILAKQFWLMVLVGGICAGAAGYALIGEASVYEARTLLLYRLGREYLYVPDANETGSGVRAPDPGDLQQIVGAEMQIFDTQQMRQRLIEEFGLTRIFTIDPDAEEPLTIEGGAEKLRDLITVALIPNTLMVQVRVRHTDPQIAAALANDLVDLYLERRDAIFFGRDGAYYEERLRSSHAAIQDIEGKMAELLSGGDPLSFDTERQILVSRQIALRSRIADVEAEISGLAQRRDLLEREIADLPKTVTEYRTVDRNPVLSAAEGRIVTLQAERDAAVAKLGVGHPNVTALDREIEALRLSIQNAPEEIEVGGRIAAHPVRTRAEGDLFEVRATLQELEARRDHLATELDQNAKALAKAATIAPDLAELQRTADLQREEAAQFDARLRDTTAEAEGKAGDPVGSVRIIERAQPPTQPVGAPASIRLFFALVFGVVVGLAAGLLAYLVRPTILTPAMLQRRLGAPVLAEIGWRRGGANRLVGGS